MSYLAKISLKISRLDKALDQMAKNKKREKEKAAMIWVKFKGKEEGEVVTKMVWGWFGLAGGGGGGVRSQQKKPN